MIHPNSKSTPPRNRPVMIATIATTIVRYRVSWNVGQVTLRSSAITSAANRGCSRFRNPNGFRRRRGSGREMLAAAVVLAVGRGIFSRTRRAGAAPSPSGVDAARRRCVRAIRSTVSPGTKRASEAPDGTSSAPAGSHRSGGSSASCTGTPALPCSASG